MTKLAKYLKPYLVALILSLCLLFVQAMTDLNLPNMMSNIINVGIQQSGIEHAAPDAISDQGYAFMLSFMTSEEQAQVGNYYTRITADAVDRNKYPDAGDKALYELKDTSTQAYSTLDPIFSRAGWTFIEFIQNQDNLTKLKDAAKAEAQAKITATIREKAQAMGIDTSSMDDATLMAMISDPQTAAALGIDSSAMTSQTSTSSSENNLLSGNTTDMSGNLDTIDITKVYQLTPYINLLSQDDLAASRAQADAVPASMREQTGSVFTKMFYKELGVNITAIQQRYIIKIGLEMLGLTLLGALAAIGVGFNASRIAAGAARHIRRDIFTKVESFSAPEFNRFGAASLITRSTNDITQIQTLIVMGVRLVCYAPIIGVGGIIMALRQNVSMGWIIGLAVGILVCVIAVIFIAVMPKFKLIQKLVDRLNLVMRENLNGMSVVRAFSNQQYEEKRFDTENINVTKTNLFVNRTMVFLMPMMMLIMNGISLLIVWIGAHQIADSAMQVGDMMAFMQYAMQIIMAFLMISMMFIMIPRASVSADRIAQVLNTEPAVKDPAGPTHFPAEHPGVLSFDHVCFRYSGADEDVLHDISFTALPGQTTAFIGSTGSGKSTLLNLIPRFSDVTEGRITLDHTDIREVTLHELRNHIGLVPQKGVLFSGTVATNLRFGKKDATDAQIGLAADIAQASSFINETPEGFDRNIAQGGGNVSGGQKQRLAIARALARKPDVYLFDDSFSALDFKTDAELRKALKPYTQNATVLIVAQRINTIMDADQIIVLDEGRIVGQGSHDTLMHTCATYRDIASSQLGGAEAKTPASAISQERRQ